MAQIAQDAQGNYYTSEDGKDWKPAPMAQNAKGDKFYQDGTEWKPAQVQATQERKPVAKPISEVAAPPEDPHMAGTPGTRFRIPEVTGNRTADIAMEPLTGYPRRLEDTLGFTRKMMNMGMADLAHGDLTGLAGYIPGALGYITAPASAAVEPFTRVINAAAGEPIERETGFPAPLTTAMLTGAMGIPEADASRVSGATPRGFKAPTNEQLRAQAKADYKILDESQALIAPTTMRNFYNELEGKLFDFGYDPANEPGIGAALDRLRAYGRGANDPATFPTIKGLETVRRVAGNAAKDVTRPSQQAAAHIVIDHLDDLIDGLESKDIVPGSGDVSNVQAAVIRARDAWSRLSKSELIDDALERAQRRAGSTGSGGNVENAVRQNIRALLDNKRTARKFSASEREMMDHIVRGSIPHNMLRLLGKLSPTSSGLMGGLELGAGLFHPSAETLALPAVGFGAKEISDRMTLANVGRLSEFVRSGAGNYGRNVIRKFSAQLPKTRNYLEETQRANAVTRQPGQSPDETPP